MSEAIGVLKIDKLETFLFYKKAFYLNLIKGFFVACPRQVKRVSLPVRVLSSECLYLSFKLDLVCPLDSNG